MSTDTRRLEGQVAIVTGASRGIGRAIAVRLAREGARVAVNYRSQAVLAQEVVEEIRTQGGEAVAVQADVADREAAAGLAAQTLACFGRIDVLVNNAGVMHRSDILHFQSAEFEEMRAVKGNCLYCARCYAACPREGPLAKGKDFVAVEAVR